MGCFSKICALTVLAALSGGCTSDDYVRTAGVTPGAGNAMAANTVMQMVDPWQYGVQNTRLLVPAERPASSAGAVDAAAGEQAASPDSGG